LIVTADDFGIGPATTQGILELAQQRRITATVLLVNSPFAEPAVHAWRQAGRPVELGWHPCLTLDAPVLAAHLVPTLVDARGRFWPLGKFAGKLLCGRIDHGEIEAELRAQLQRFCELVGQPPSTVNSHHHVQVFPPVGAILQRVLAGLPRPYMRRVREPWTTITAIPGARGKRAFLNALGRREARLQERAGISGNDWLAGVTDPPYVADPAFLARWLTRLPGQVGELTCHPGHHDVTLIGRDCTPHDGQLRRRTDELALLQQSDYLTVCRQAGWNLVSPAEWLAGRAGFLARVA
jgi:predicted glycoside hydrolase/deacetylase ChbG (UPF0249 family)